MDESEQVSRSAVTATISGPVSGQVAIGSDINQVQTIRSARVEISEADLAALRQAFADLRAQVEQLASPDKKGIAAGHVDELEEAVTAKQPDLTTMEYIKRWFARNVPQLAGSVAAVVVHPIVGKLVEAAGESLAAEFRRRFGGA